MPLLIALALVFGQLSLAAFGGGNTILPEMQRQFVTVHGWLSAAEFNALYGLAQAAPGPNMMVVTLLGWQVAGLWGALVATLAQFVPSSLLTAVVVHVFERARDAPWRRTIQAGLVPITAGLVAASAALIAGSAAAAPMPAAIAAVVAGLSLTTRAAPLWWLGLGAAVGALGFGFA
jgi:chromate transporter